MKYLAYIDESGDEGVQRGTEWLILTAVIVSHDNDHATSKVIDEIKETLGIGKEKPIHWVKFRKDHGKKKFVVKRIAETDFFYINVAINTHMISKRELQGRILYNYGCKFLIERICWLMESLRGKVDIIFSDRKCTSYKDLSDYIMRESQNPRSEIRPDIISSIQSLQPIQRKMLQFADICASSFAEALNCDTYGNYEDYYVKILQNKLYRRCGKALSYGIKVYPNKARDYFERYPWLNEIN